MYIYMYIYSLYEIACPKFMSFNAQNRGEKVGKALVGLH